MIDCFDNENAFLSNFYEHDIFQDGIRFPSNEHFYQSAKSVNPKREALIMQSMTPDEAKHRGRSFEPRPDWEEIKDGVMLEAALLKFSDPELQEKLLATGEEELVEGNTWHDNYWGDCRCELCRNIPGQNKLGKTLMLVRKAQRDAIKRINDPNVKTVKWVSFAEMTGQKVKYHAE